MKILYSADTHCAPRHLHRFLCAAEELEVDCLILGGDLVPVAIRRKYPKIKDCVAPQRRWVEEVLLPAMGAFSEQFPDKKILFDFGNDDIMANRRFLGKDDGKKHDLLHGSIVELAPGLAVVGYMKIPMTPFMLKDWELPDRQDHIGRGKNLRKKGVKTWTGKIRETKLKKIVPHDTIQGNLAGLSEVMNSAPWAEYKFVFVCHCPPADTALDLMYGYKHVGSESVREFIEQWSADSRLLTSLHGHIHESPELSGRVYDIIGHVPCFNMGQEEEVLQALLLDVDDAVGSLEKIRVDGHCIIREKFTIGCN